MCRVTRKTYTCGHEDKRVDSECTYRKLNQVCFSISEHYIEGITECLSCLREKERRRKLQEKVGQWLEEQPEKRGGRGGQAGQDSS